MSNIMRGLIRAAVFILIFEGLRSIWDFAEVAMYGYSQASVVDSVANLFITNRLDTIIWDKERTWL